MVHLLGTIISCRLSDVMLDQLKINFSAQQCFSYFPHHKVVPGDVPSHRIYPNQRVCIIIVGRRERLLNADPETEKVEMHAHMPFCRIVAAVMCNMPSKYISKSCSLVWCFFSIKITPLMLARSCSLSFASRLKLQRQWNIWFGFFLFFLSNRNLPLCISKTATPMGWYISIFAQVCLWEMISLNSFIRNLGSKYRPCHICWLPERKKGFFISRLKIKSCFAVKGDYSTSLSSQALTCKQVRQ